MPKIRPKPTNYQLGLLAKIKNDAVKLRRAERAAQRRRNVLYSRLREARRTDLAIDDLARASGWTGPRITQITHQEELKTA